MGLLFLAAAVAAGAWMVVRFVQGWRSGPTRDS